MWIKPKKSILGLLIAIMTIAAFSLFAENAVADPEGTMIDQDTGTQYIMPGEQMVVQEVIISDSGSGDGGSLSIDCFRLSNQGTASNSQMENVSLWKDDGDGSFDAETDNLRGYNNALPESGSFFIGENDNFPVCNVPNGVGTYRVFVVVDLSATASEDGNTIQTRLDGADLCSTSVSSWSDDGAETATSATIIDTIPTATLYVDTSPVYEGDLDFEVRVVYDQIEMNTSVTPSIQFSGNSGWTSIVGSPQWDESHTIWTQTYKITDVDEWNIVTVSSSGAEDLNGNTEGPCNSALFTVETVAPSIDSVTGSTTGTTGETTTIYVNFSDNVGVTNATMHYMMLGSGWQSKSILSGSADIDIPSDSTNNWYYYVVVNDSAGNGDRSPSGIGWFAVLITDNDAPTFSNLPTTHPTAGDNYNFTVTVSDNIAVDEVYLNYYFSGSWNNVSMTYSTINDNYFKVLLVPSDATVLHYNVSANDTNNNWGETGDTTITVDHVGNGDGNGGSEENVPPVADAGGPYQGVTNKTITFDGSGSSDSDGDIVNYTWDFGDNTTGYSIKPIHSYNTSGLYDITLTVKDDDGLTSISTTTVNITLDSDGDGYSDEMEDSYGTNATDPNEFPLDTDKDGIPDEDSEDGNYTGDPDDDNDGLNDEIEEELGSDPKNESDVKSIDSIEGGYLVDTNGTGQYDAFYNATSGVTTNVTTNEDGNYLIDNDGDGECDFIHDPETGETTPYTGVEEPDEGPPSTTMIIIIVAIIIILAVIIVLFKKGYIRI